eukprot:4518460-Pyramimonas_sp.AAC.1
MADIPEMMFWPDVRLPWCKSRVDSQRCYPRNGVLEVFRSQDATVTLIRGVEVPGTSLWARFRIF